MKGVWLLKLKITASDEYSIEEVVVYRERPFLKDVVNQSGEQIKQGSHGQTDHGYGTVTGGYESLNGYSVHYTIWFEEFCEVVK